MRTHFKPLDLKSATAAVSYQLNGVKYQRTHFISAPDEVFVSKSKPYDTLMADHLKDHRTYFDRVSLQLGDAEAQKTGETPTDQRLVDVANGKPDDNAYLAKVYPILKGSAQFYLDNLMVEP